MNTYSQNREDLFVLKHFGNYKGTLLEIGSNDGQTLSNSLALIQQGWKAHLIEPGRTFSDLVKLHYTNPNVSLYNYAIGGEFQTEATFFESGAHVIGGKDMGLVSSLDFDETERWRKSGVQFTETKVPVKTFREFWNEAGKPQLDYISIDAEGYDWDILQQIDLKEIGCKCLVIEWNGDGVLSDKITRYCNMQGLKFANMNRENLIFTI